MDDSGGSVEGTMGHIHDSSGACPINFDPIDVANRSPATLVKGRHRIRRRHRRQKLERDEEARRELGRLRMPSNNTILIRQQACRVNMHPYPAYGVPAGERPAFGSSFEE